MHYDDVYLRLQTEQSVFGTETMQFIRSDLAEGELLTHMSLVWKHNDISGLKDGPETGG